MSCMCQICYLQNASVKFDRVGGGLYYGAPKSSVRVGLEEGSELFSLRYIVSSK